MRSRHPEGHTSSSSRSYPPGRVGANASSMAVSSRARRKAELDSSARLTSSLSAPARMTESRLSASAPGHGEEQQRQSTFENLDFRPMGDGLCEIARDERALGLHARCCFQSGDGGY